MGYRGCGLVLGVAIGGSALGAPGAGAATKNVSAGPPLERPPAGVPQDANVNAFFPRAVTVRRGDRVRFAFRGFHNVVFPAGGQPPPGFIAADPATPVAGVNDAAGAAFWFNGQPRLVLDPRSAMPTGGTRISGRALVSSGLPLSEGRSRPFTASFPRSGTFRYLCTVHPGMRGTVRVAGRSGHVPSAAQDRRTVQRQLARNIATARRLARFRGPRGERVQAGSDAGEVTLLRFVPARKRVRVGAMVTLQMAQRTSETHTFSFGPAAVLRQAARAIVTPVAGGQGPPTLVFNPLIGYPSDRPPLPA